MGFIYVLSVIKGGSQYATTVAHKVGTFHLLPTVSSCMESGRHIAHCHRITVSNATSVGH